MSEKGGIDKPLLDEKQVEKLMGKKEKKELKKKVEEIQKKHKKVCKEITDTDILKDKQYKEWLKIFDKAYYYEADMKYASREYLKGGLDIAKYMELYEINKKYEKSCKEIEKKIKDRENIEDELYELMGIVYESDEEEEEEEEEDDEDDVPEYRGRRKLYRRAGRKSLIPALRRAIKRCKDKDCDEE